jgi:hypothetical protein
MDFDGIELSDLENSGSTFEAGATPSVDDTDDNTGNEGGDNNSPQNTPDTSSEEDGIDAEFLAGLENTEDDDDTTGGNTEDGKEDIKAPSADDKATSSSQNTFTSLASALNEEGAFNMTEEELAGITDADSLLKAVLAKTEENTFSELTDNQKEYLDAMRTGIPHETYATHKANADQYKQLQNTVIQEKPALGQELIKRGFLIQGMDVEKAGKYAALAMKDESWMEDAIKAKNALVAFEEGKIQTEINARKQSEQDAQLKAEKELSELKSKVTESSEVIPGIRINSQTKDKVFTSMTTPVSTDEDGNPLNEVMEKYANDLEYKMRLHTLHNITKGFTDFSKFSKTFKSEAAKKLEKQIENNDIKTGGAMKATGVVSASQIKIKDAIDKLDLGKL